MEPIKTPQIADSVRRGTAKEAAMLHNAQRVLTTAAEQQIRYQS